MAMSLLEVKNVSRHFGGLAAVNQVDVVVDEGENPRPYRPQRRG